MNAKTQAIVDIDLEERFRCATDIIRDAGLLAKGYFTKTEDLAFEVKGPQDFVSIADVETERCIVERLRARFPEDGILGEESGASGDSQIVWVVDPIDGTQAFSTGLSSWCVVIALVVDGITEIALVFDPNANELFAARRGRGATLNGKPIACQKNAVISKGLVSVGYPKRMRPADVLPVLERLLDAGGMFHRNGSGALSLCYVASGRLLGYVEAQMHSWDCLAGILLVREASGRTVGFSNGEALTDVSRVVAAASGVFDPLDAILGHSEVSSIPI